MVEANLSGSEEEDDPEYLLLEQQSQAELEKVQKQLLQLPLSEHSLFLRQTVSDCEEQYLALTRDVKQISTKHALAVKMKMDGKIVSQLEEALASKEN